MMSHAISVVSNWICLSQLHLITVITKKIRTSNKYNTFKYLIHNVPLNILSSPRSDIELNESIIKILFVNLIPI